MRIEIQTSLDLTPQGKRTARIVKTTRGAQLRWYVSGKLYSRKSNNAENAALTLIWLAAN